MSQVKVTHDAGEVGHTPDFKRVLAPQAPAEVGYLQDARPVSALQALVEIGHTLEVARVSMLQMVVEVGYVEAAEGRVSGPAVQCCG
jgi:hypothetical protein